MMQTYAARARFLAAKSMTDDRIMPATMMQLG
jgi:hypothetical protein